MKTLKDSDYIKAMLIKCDKEDTVTREHNKRLIQISKTLKNLERLSRNVH